MTESKSFNHTATVILTVMVVFAMMPILLIVSGSGKAGEHIIVFIQNLKLARHGLAALGAV